MLKQITNTPGTLLRQLRQSKGMTQAQLGKAVGIPQSHIHRIEAGADLRTSTLVALAQALGYDIAIGSPATIGAARVFETPPGKGRFE